MRFCRAEGPQAEGWIRGAEGQTELFEQSEKSEGPSRPASPDTARPAQRAGQPQKKAVSIKETASYF
nr:hypothetical protein [Saprospira grandis]